MKVRISARWLFFTIIQSITAVNLHVGGTDAGETLVWKLPVVGKRLVIEKVQQSSLRTR